MLSDAIKQVAFFFIHTVVVVGCVNQKDKGKLFSQKIICGDLWIEKFRVFSGGAYSAELFADYLTDSSNFRVFVGNHDERSNFDYKCNGDSIVVHKFSIDEDDQKSIVKQSVFSLSKLKSEHQFE